MDDQDSQDQHDQRAQNAEHAEHDAPAAVAAGTPTEESSLPTTLRRAVDLWWCAVVLGILTTTVQLVSGRVRAGVTIDGSAGAQIAVDVVGAVLTAVLAVAYWLVQLLAVRGLRTGRRPARIVLTVLGAVSVVVDVVAIVFTGLPLPAGAVVAVLCGLHVVVVVAAGIAMYRPAASAYLRPGEPAVPVGEVRRADTTATVAPAARPARRGVVVGLVAAGVVLVAVEAAAALAGLTRVGVENAVSEGVAAELGAPPAPVSCGWTAGLDSLAGDTAGQTCTADLDGLPTVVDLTSPAPLQVSYSASHLINARKVAAAVQRGYAERGRRVNVACVTPDRRTVTTSYVGMQLSCTTTDVAGAHTRVVARVTDDRGSLSFSEVTSG